MCAERHVSVLLDQAVEALIGSPGGFYIDGTYGRGGHSRAVLSKLDSNGRLLVIDKDPRAIAHARETIAKDSRVGVHYCSFAELGRLAERENLVGKVDGVLLDLGVSSPQLDDPERGFSFSQDGPLDMRMDHDSGVSAAQWLAAAKEQDIARVIKDLGEERFARRMARAIVAARAEKPITRTGQLADIVAKANPAWEKGKHPATRAFQAIRIYINRELEDLSSALNQALEVLAVGGRLVVISFHSLEDRIVKRFIREQERGRDLPRRLPVTADKINRRLRHVGKALKAADSEVSANVRARSAIMRVAEKLA